MICDEPHTGHAVYLTAFGPVYLASAVYRRALRTQKWRGIEGRSAERYLDDWAAFQYAEGRDIIGHPDNQPPKAKP